MYKNFIYAILFVFIISFPSCNRGNINAINSKTDAEMSFINSRDFSENEIELKLRYYVDGILSKKTCFYLDKENYIDGQILPVPSFFEESYTGLSNYCDGYYLDRNFKKNIDVNMLMQGDYGKSVEIFIKLITKELPEIEYNYRGFSYKNLDGSLFYNFKDSYLFFENNFLLINEDDNEYKIGYSYYFDEKGTKTGIIFENISLNEQEMDMNPRSISLTITTHFPNRRCLLIEFITNIEEGTSFCETFIQCEW